MAGITLVTIPKGSGSSLTQALKQGVGHAWAPSIKLMKSYLINMYMCVNIYIYIYITHQFGKIYPLLGLYYLDLANKRLKLGLGRVKLDCLLGRVD